MATKVTILVGTIGQGVMISADDGKSWTRGSVRHGMHSDCILKALRQAQNARARTKLPHG